jgi:hypothetical protein
VALGQLVRAVPQRSIGPKDCGGMTGVSEQSSNAARLPRVHVVSSFRPVLDGLASVYPAHALYTRPDVGDVPLGMLLLVRVR